MKTRNKLGLLMAAIVAGSFAFSGDAAAYSCPLKKKLKEWVGEKKAESLIKDLKKSTKKKKKAKAKKAAAKKAKAKAAAKKK